MPICEISGKEVDKLYKIKVEGTIVRVCKEHISLDTLLSEKPAKFKASNMPKPSPVKEKKTYVVSNYGEIIRKKREKMGLKQKEFALFLAEKDSFINNIESGKQIPSIKTARKIEKYLGVSLISEETSGNASTVSEKKNFTIGDVMNVNKK